MALRGGTVAQSNRIRQSIETAKETVSSKLDSNPKLHAIKDSAHELAGKYSNQFPEAIHRVEETTSKLPPSGYLALALGSMAISAGLALIPSRKTAATFVGLWVPSLLLMGIYTKLVSNSNSSAHFSRRSSDFNGSSRNSILPEDHSFSAEGDAQINPKAIRAVTPHTAPDDDIVSYKRPHAPKSPSGKGTGGYSY
jgi:hypothetical protein